MKILILPLVALSFGSPLQERDTYTLTVAGMKCTQSEPGYQRLPQTECAYAVGKGLRFSLVGIGQPDATWTVMKSDFDSDFFISFPFGKTADTHDCAIVKPGRTRIDRTNDMADYAFVSPRTGKVFREWRDCKGR